jgi:hypothetical protein
VAFGNPGGSGADHEGELAGDLEEDGGDGGEAVGPDVPGGEEADGVAEGAAGPDVEAAFERHLAVEKVNGDGHGRVEDGEGEEPDEGLGVAEAGGEAYPGASDDGEDLGEDEVTEGELAGEMVVAGGVDGRGIPVGGRGGHWVHRLTRLGREGEAGALCRTAERGGEARARLPFCDRRHMRFP